MTSSVAGDIATSIQQRVLSGEALPSVREELGLTASAFRSVLQQSPDLSNFIRTHVSHGGNVVAGLLRPFQDRPWLHVFLQALRDGATVQEACAEAEVSRQFAYSIRSRYPQVWFAQQWDAIDAAKIAEQTKTAHEASSTGVDTQGSTPSAFLQELYPAISTVMAYVSVGVTAKQACNLVGVHYQMVAKRRGLDCCFAGEWSAAVRQGRTIRHIYPFVPQVIADLALAAHNGQGSGKGICPQRQHNEAWATAAQAFPVIGEVAECIHSALRLRHSSQVKR